MDALHSDLKTLSVADVVRHIVTRHHAYALAMITVLRPLLRRALAADAKGPGLLDATALFDELAFRLLNHQAREEAEVFPAVAAAAPEATALVCAALDEHRRLLRLLELLDDAVARFTRENGVLAAGLRDLGADIRRHLELERELIFGRIGR